MNLSIMRPRPVKTVLLTGATGVLGQSLVDVLSPTYRLVCLLHRNAIAGNCLDFMFGDITQPQLGLGSERYAQLVEQVDWIIHSAAVTRLEGDDEEIELVNIAGTANLLELARHAACPLYHVSTAFTHDCDYFDGVMAATTYETSKRQAEQLVRDSGIPASIFRPSIIIGDTRSGHMPRFQGFYMTLGLIASGALPVVPSPAIARVDAIARVVSSSAAKRLSRTCSVDCFSPGWCPRPPYPCSPTIFIAISRWTAKTMVRQASAWFSTSLSTPCNKTALPAPAAQHCRRACDYGTVSWRNSIHGRKFRLAAGQSGQSLAL